MFSDELARLYPHLFQEVIWPWGPTRASFVLLGEAPPIDLIANVNIVPRSGEAWVILQLADGNWEIPGGTLEPGEGYLGTIQRELKEEAGARLLSHEILGAWSCLSLADRPYQPHLPYPRFYRLILTGEIRIEKSPVKLPGAENITGVEITALETVVERFISQNRYELAELYLLANTIQNLSHKN